MKYTSSSLQYNTKKLLFFRIIHKIWIGIKRIWALQGQILMKMSFHLFHDYLFFVRLLISHINKCFHYIYADQIKNILLFLLSWKVHLFKYYSLIYQVDTFKKWLRSLSISIPDQLQECSKKIEQLEETTSSLKSDIDEQLTGKHDIR